MMLPVRGKMWQHCCWQCRHKKCFWIAQYTEFVSPQMLHAWWNYNPGQKYMVHLENWLCFHYRPLFDDKSGSFSQTWPSPPPPPPIQCCFKGDTDPTLHGGGGRGEGMVKLSKKAKCTITFDQDCSQNLGNMIMSAKLPPQCVLVLLTPMQCVSALRHTILLFKRLLLNGDLFHTHHSLVAAPSSSAAVANPCPTVCADWLASAGCDWPSARGPGSQPHPLL